MKARDLADYLTKKIAKPMAYSYRKPDPIWSTDRNYVVEPTAVEDNVLHALVTLKSQTGEGGRIKLSNQPVFCGEVQIPFEDEDCVLQVLAMAIAEADFGPDCMRFAEDDLMRVAYEDLHGRQAYSEMRRIGII